MLFQISGSGPNAKLAAYLINDPRFGDGKPGHAHDHETEVQILTGEEQGTLIPTVLKPGATLDIVALGQTGVEPRSSFFDHVPDLETIIANATDGVQNAGQGNPNRE